MLVSGPAAAYVVASYLPHAGVSPLASPCALAGALLLVAGVSMLAQPGAEQLLLGSGAIVLAAIVGDGKSPAAGLLKTHGMTFEEAIRALQKASA